MLEWEAMEDWPSSLSSLEGAVLRTISAGPISAGESLEPRRGFVLAAAGASAEALSWLSEQLGRPPI